MKTFLSSLLCLFLFSCTLSFVSCQKTNINTVEDSFLPSARTTKISQLSVRFSSEIPDNMRVFIPKSNPGSYAVYDEFDGNPGEEGVIFLDHPDYPSHLQLNLYSKEENTWKQKGWSLIQGELLDWVYLHKQFIYVGVQQHNKKKTLYIYLIDTIAEEWSLSRVNSIDYDKLYIENFPGAYGNDDKPEIARWITDEDGDETIQLFRLSSWEYNFNFVFAEDSYPYFYPSIVEEYKEKVRSNSSNLELSLQLIEYETYAQDSAIALQKIKRLLQSQMNTMSTEQKNLLVSLQCKCLLQLGQYEEAQLILQNWIPDIPDEPFPMKLFKKKAYIFLQDSLLKQGKYSASKSVWELMPKISSEEYEMQKYPIELPPQIDLEPKANYIEPYQRIQNYFQTRDFHNLLLRWDSFQEWGTSQSPLIEVSDPVLPSLLPDTFEGMVLFQVKNMGTVIAWAEDQSIRTSVLFYIDSFSHQHSEFSKPEKFYTNQGKMALILHEKPSQDLSLKAYQYFTLSNDQWRLQWTSPFYPNGSIHVNEPNFEMVTAKGQIILDPTGKSYLFGECSSSTYHRFYEEVWILDQETYSLMSSSIVQSPYQTLVDYLHYLYNSNTEKAKEFVTDPSLIEQTKELEIVGNTGFYSCPKWVQNSKGEDVITFRVKDRENVAFYFTRKQGRYTIYKIEENPDLTGLFPQVSQ